MTSVLKDNNAINAADDSQLEHQRKLKMLDSIIKVQSQLVNYPLDHPHLSHVLGDMNKEIKVCIGNSPESENMLT